jgi:hypothetical protein
VLGFIYKVLTEFYVTWTGADKNRILLFPNKFSNIKFSQQFDTPNNESWGQTDIHDFPIMSILVIL